MLIAIVVALAGCGSDDEGGSTSQPAVASTQSTSQTASTATADTTAKTATEDRTTSTASTKTTTTAKTVKVVKPKKPTQKPASLSVVRKRAAALAQARAACRANPKLASAGGLPCAVVRAEARLRARQNRRKTGNRLPTCPDGEYTVNGKPCLRK